MARLTKKLIILSCILFAIAALSFSMTDGTGIKAYAAAGAPEGISGSGTQGDPYLISSAAEWNTVALYCNTTSTAGVYFRLEANIDMAGKDVIPIGTSARPFHGKFNGAGNVIVNVNIDTTEQYAGLFGYVGTGGDIYSFGVYGGSIKGISYAGGIAAYNTGKISNSFSTASVISTGNYAGGVAGYNTGILLCVYSTGSVQASGASGDVYAGGVAGYLKDGGTISYCYSLSAVSSSGYVGGVIGGRDNTVPTVVYSYYNKDFMTGSAAIGRYVSGTNSGAGNINTGSNRVDGLTSLEFEQYTLNALNFSAPQVNGEWVKNYRVSDASAYFAPSLKSFMPSQGTNFYSYNSVIIRLYGSEDGTGEWGSETNPYIISKPSHLINLSSAVNLNAISYFGKYFKMVNHIDMNGVTLNPIGNYISRRPFSGSFDGDNKAIQNLNMDYATAGVDYVALFGFTDTTAVIKNLIFENNCTFSGRNYVATVSGYNAGIINNVESRASVRGTSNLGGIVGYNVSGTLTNILSVVTFYLNAGGTGVNGIIGVSSKSTVRNAWYVGYYNSVCTTASNGGRLMYVDRNGDINVNKSINGAITFNTKSAATRYTVDFRTSNENSVGQNGTYAPDINSSSSETVYARFVKELSVINPSSGEMYLLGLSGIRKSVAYYYDGQKVSAQIWVNSGYFLNKAYYMDIYGQEGVSFSPEYAYDAMLSSEGAIVINIEFLMGEMMVNLGANIQGVGATSISERFYDGTATVYTFSKPGYPDFTFENNYGTPGGYAPVNAGNDYKLTILVKKDGKMRGKQTLGFIINKRPLYVPEEALTKEKQYDGKPADVFVSLPVDQSMITSYPSPLGYNIVPIDVVVGGINKVVVNSLVDFNSMQIGNAKTAEYQFTLTGISADNYVVPEAQVYHDGIITKRMVVYEIYEDKGRLTRVFDGSRSAITNYGTVYGKEGVEGLPVNPVIGFKLIEGETETVSDAVNVGLYRLVIAASGGSEAYYDVTFKKDYFYTVTALPVPVTFTNTTLTYNGSVQSIGGYYFDTSNVKQTLSVVNFTYKKLTGDEYIASDLQNAGTYIAKVTLTGNYAAKNTDGYSDECTVIVNKAAQAPLDFAEITGIHTYGDPAVTLSVTGGSGDGEITFSVISGFGVVNGNLLSFTGGGLIALRVDKGESENYLSAYATQGVTVEKALLTISLADFSTGYGEDIIFDFEFEGFVNGDTFPAGFVAPTAYIDEAAFDIEAFYPVKTESGLVVPYLFTFDSDASSNGYTFDYSLLSSGVRFTVTKKTIVVRADDFTSVYGSDLVPLTFKVYAFENGNETLLAENEYNLIITLYKTPGLGAGEYAVLCGENSAEENLEALLLQNPDYQIDYYAGTYTITPKTLNLTLIGNETDPLRPEIKFNKKYYGEADPLILNTNLSVTGLAYDDTVEDALRGKINNSITESITRAAGENAYMQNNPSLLYGYYVYYASEIEVSPNYTLMFYSINLRIYPKEPVVTRLKDIKAQYGDPLSAITLDDKLSAPSSGSFAWKTPSMVPDFSESPTLDFEVVFSSANRNFTDAEITVSVTVIPRELTVSFEGYSGLVYNGMERTPVEYEIHNIITGDEVNAALTYFKNGAPVENIKDAGAYTALVTINNSNYILTGDVELEFAVAKAPLLIYLNDISLPEGEVPVKQFIYEGFVNEEDTDVLTSLPNVTFYTEAGNYELTPSGASAANYEITYRTSIQQVTKTRLTSPIQNFVLKGQFDERLEFVLGEIKRAENKVRFTAVSEQFETYKLTDSDMSGMKVALLFSSLFTLDGEEGALEGMGRASFTLPAKLIETKKFAVMLVKSDGTMVKAENVVREGDTLSFDMTDCDYFAIVCPPDYTWIILSGVVFILLIAVFALDLISEKLGIGRHKRKTQGKAGYSK